MLRDNLVGLIDPMLSSAGAYPLALCTARKKPSDDRPPCLENPRPEGAESTLTENAASPFHAEPKHDLKKAEWQTRNENDINRVVDFISGRDGCTQLDITDGLAMSIKTLGPLLKRA